MHDAIRDRFQRDLSRLRSPSGNVDVPGLLAAWMDDGAWVAEISGMGEEERDARLADLGREAYQTDAGRYASELRHNTRSLDSYWSIAEREAFLETHVALLFAAAFDPLVMRKLRDGQTSIPVDLHGEALLRHERASGRGILLLAVNQGHPGPVLYHPALRSWQIGVIQHSPALPAGASQALTADGRVRQLPASVAGARHALKLLTEGQCVMLASDFIFPGVAAIRSTLFARPVMISQAMISLARRTGAAVLPASLERADPASSRRYEASIFPRLPLGEERGPSTLGAIAEAFGLVTESLIRRSPEQWRLWNTLEDRWLAGALSG